MPAPQPDARAILNPDAGEQRFAVDWVPPHPDLAAIVAHHWTVRWDVGQQPYVQAILSHPNVHVATELHDPISPTPRRRIEVHGVVRGTFSRELHRDGRVHGIKFRAGTFQGLLGGDVASLTDRVVDATTILGDAWRQAAVAAIDLDDDRGAAALLDAALLERVPEPDRTALDTADLVERVQGDRSITRTSELAALAGVSERTLQRTFARYVGVGPKWVVRTFRLQEAAAALRERGRLDLAELAAALGYSDQAHLTTDFRLATGHPPAAYAAQQRASGR